MKKLKVIKLDSFQIEFEDGFILESTHNRDCCEEHYLSIGDLDLKDFDGLEFDLSNDKFFRKIDDYGIELCPINGHSVKIPGYGFNNGYYSSELILHITNNKGYEKEYDISECQKIEG